MKTLDLNSLKLQELKRKDVKMTNGGAPVVAIIALCVATYLVLADYAHENHH